MMENCEQTKDAEAGALSENSYGAEMELMRQYIIKVAQNIEDMKILKMLYLRAKTLQNI